MSYFNPPSPWGEGRPTIIVAITSRGISIHPPRGGRDAIALLSASTASRISIHPPRGGRDQDTIFNGVAFEFQSTLPVGGGTLM